MMYNNYHYPPYPHGYYPVPYGHHPYMQPVHPYPQEMNPSLPLTDEELDRQSDQGNHPYVVNIDRATERNRAFRRVIWTGRHLQLVLMSLAPGEDIGLQVHPSTDQFTRIEEPNGVVQMADRRNQFTFKRRVGEDDAILIPAGKWHNLRNTGRKPLKLYTIYAPPEHRRGTVHWTKQEAMQHHNHGHRDDGMEQMQ